MKIFLLKLIMFFSLTSPFLKLDAHNENKTKDNTSIATLTVYFKKPTAWKEAKIYYWNAKPVGSITTSAWPGKNMTLVCGDWYKFDLTGATSANVIFNSGTGIQTPDLLNVTTTKYYDNGWLAATPTICPDITTGSIDVYFENTANWSQPKVYCWSASPNTYTGCTNYPGNNMTKVNNCGNWWKYTFTGVTATNLIFNDGSTTNKTVDLNRNLTGIYNYSWSTKTWSNGVPSCSVVVNPNPSNLNTDIMIQGFYWEPYKYQTEKWYTTVKNKAEEIGKSGINVIWMPPPSQSGDGRGYLPTSYFNLDASAYGNYSQLTEANAALKQAGIKTLADIVINHRNGTRAFADFTSPNWDCGAVLQDDEVNGVGGQIQPCSGRNDNEGGERLVNQFFKYEAARDINHANVTVQNGIKEYLNLLKKA
jgi:hypothetical protein